MADDNIILIWKDEDPPGRRCLRGVRPDGSFYGTFELYEPRLCGTVDGQLADGDNVMLHQVVDRICDSAHSEGKTDETREWRGVLAIGSFAGSNKTRILDYRKGDEQHLPKAADFLALVAIMRPYVELQIQAQFQKWRSGT
jgi:hypothetical protein